VALDDPPPRFSFEKPGSRLREQTRILLLRLGPSAAIIRDKANDASNELEGLAATALIPEMPQSRRALLPSRIGGELRKEFYSATRYDALV
jgi:hypothetical protein